MDAIMSNNSQTIKSYWDKRVGSKPPEYIGTSPQGGCGISEVYYRLYFEPRHLKKLINFSKDMTVLELGCGGGRWALSIAPLVKKYIAVDFSRPTLDIAIKQAKQKKLNNIEFRESSIQEFIPQEDYDLIYFSGVIQYVTDSEVEKILSNLLPHTKSDTIILDRSTISLENRVVTDTERYFSIYRTESELINLFKGSGLRLTNKSRSYRFMRFPKIFKLPVVREKLPKLILIAKPLSFHVFYALNYIADTIYPIRQRTSLRGRVFWYDHCFFVFDKI